MNSETNKAFSLSKRHLIFFLVLFAFVGCAVLRSSIATPLDGFTLDNQFTFLDRDNFNHNFDPPLIRLPYRKQRAVMKSLVLLEIPNDFWQVNAPVAQLCTNLRIK